MGQLQNTEARGPRGLDSGSQDFMKPILSTERHRRSTFFTEMFSVKKISLFSKLPLSTPQTSQDHCRFLFFMLTRVSIWNTQYSAGIWVTHTEKGNPIIVSPHTWNEWICTVSSGLDSNADTTMTSRRRPHAKALQAFHPRQRRARVMTSPRIFGSPGRCLFIIAAAAFEYRWSRENIYHLFALPKGIHHASSDPIWFASEKQGTTTNGESCKIYRSQENVFPFLCLSLGWSPKQANTSYIAKTRNCALRVYLYDLCCSSVAKKCLLARALLPHTIQVVNTEVIKQRINLGVQNSGVTELLYDLKTRHELPQPKCLNLT